MKLIRSIIELLKEIFNYQPHAPLSSEDLARRITIWPYCEDGEWMFDDYTVGLTKEPLRHFPEVIDPFMKGKRIRNKKISIQFSASPFPQYDIVVVRTRSEMGGNWYYSPDFDSEVWLCSALFCYYPSAPSEIYVRIQGENY